jgi:sulfur relay (sulfurtransferase) DsrC/TusE family protein
MPIINFEGKEIEFDNNGHLINFSEWSRVLAVYMADEDGLMKLGNDKRHWPVLELLRDLYKKGMLPASDGEILFLIMKGTGLSIAKLHRIFEGLSIPGLLKWAGLPAISLCPGGVCKVPSALA